MDEDPIKVSNKYHSKYSGKLEVMPKVPIESNKIDRYSSIWYTPGVAEPCKEIDRDKSEVYKYTNKGNSIAVVSDGSRVLGLGDIGPEAGLPVMEGKSLLFKYLGDVDAVPLTIDVEDADEIVNFVGKIEPSFGGINLEDIETPKCFKVLDRLRKRLEIPVWHDDQQGTAVASLAGLLGALKVVGKKPEDIKLVIGGAGAAGISNAKYAIKGGVKPHNVKIVDSKGILSPARSDIEGTYKEKWAKRTNPQEVEGGMKEALDGADACISASKPGPGTIKKNWLEGMEDDAILFAEANPVPEIMPEEAKEVGVRIIATGRSDYPNQVNNSIVFPAVLKGALEVQATDITDKMCVEAAKAISQRAEEIGLHEEFIIPRMSDSKMFVNQAVAVGMQAIKEGVARIELSKEELEDRISNNIDSIKQKMNLLMEKNLIDGLD